MRTTVRAAAELPHATAHFARRRVAFALSRFDNRLRAVTARITSVDGLRGGLDTRCEVTVRFDMQRRPIVVEETDVDACLAIERAVDRAARSVARALRTQMDWGYRQERAVTRS